MSEILAQVTRGPMVESVHRGSVAVTNGAGELLYWAGDPGLVTYMRSSAKPLQAMNVLLSGTDKLFGFTHKELAIMCASHYGEPMHKEVIQGILHKIGLPKEALKCGFQYSISAAYKEKQLQEHMVIDEMNSNCSGKHCGFLAACVQKGYSIGDYYLPEHPVQQEVLGIVARMSGVPADSILLGIDGCGVPVHGLPVQAMARSFARLTTPEDLSPEYASACRTIVTAMNEHPEMIAGTNGFCTEFLKHTGGRFAAKTGAEGVYCIGVKDLNMGIALKIEDGNGRAVPAVMLDILMQLNLLSEEDLRSLDSFAHPVVKNVRKEDVGVIRPCYTLHKA